MEVGGDRFEVLQITLPEFDSIAEDTQEDVKRVACLQLPLKQRLLDMKVDEDLKLDQLVEDKNNIMKKVLTQAAQGRQVSAYLKTWRGSQRTAMERDGMSRDWCQQC